MSDDPQLTAERVTVPLNEFCQDMSRGDPRVELIAVFVYRERAAGREHDTAAAYTERFNATFDSPLAGETRPVSR